MFNISNPNAKRRMQDQILRRMASLERSFGSAVSKIIASQYRTMAEMVRNGYRDFMYLDQWFGDLANVFMANYRRVGVAGSKMLFDQVPNLGKSIRISEHKGMGDVFWDVFLTFVRLVVARKVTMVQETTKNRIRQLISLGIRAGNSPQEIGREIGRIAGIDSRMRGRRIARTEVHMAMNISTMAAAKSTGLRLTKEWVCMRDERTRKNHKKANGQIIGMDDLFKVGDEHLSYPGDPSGSAGNVINCRCVLLYHTQMWPGGNPMVNKR